MNQNQQLIKKFYDCFAERDWKGMGACYGEDIFFYDPVFLNLEGAQVRAMWEMLLRNANDLTLSVSQIVSEDEYGTCQWQASYTFSATGRHVVNKGKTFMKMEGGKIIEHSDQFSFWNWSRQALGLKGLLLGGTTFLQSRVRKQAWKNLERFMIKSNSSQQ